MKRTNQVVPAALASLLAFCLLVPSAAAWHWEDEITHEFKWGKAGDPLIKQDAADCLESAAGLVDLSCTVLYGHPDDLNQAQPMDLIRPTDCSPGRDEIPSPLVPYYRSGSNQVLFSPVLHPWYRQSAPDCNDDVFSKGYLPDLTLHPAEPIRGTWYLSYDPVAPVGTEATPMVGTLPCVTLRMTLEDHPHKADPVVLTSAETTKTVITEPGAGLGDTGLDDPCPGAKGTVSPQEITRFDVELEPPDEVALGDNRLRWNVSWYQWDADDLPDPKPAVLDGWVVHAEKEHFPHLVFGVQEPFPHFEMELQQYEEGVAFIAVFGTPWGTYDLDHENIRFTVTDEEGEPVALEHLEGPKRYNAHYRDHQDLNEFHFLWDIWQEDLGDGVYPIEWKMTNFQHTADQHWNATLVVDGDAITLYPGQPQAEPEDLSTRPGQANALPGPGLILMAATALLAALINHRRQRTER